MNLEATLWYALALDCIIVIIIGIFFIDWYREKFPAINKFFPISIGWCLAYLCLVIWLGCLLWRLDVLPW
jgi:hypothetical protein